MLPRSSGKFRSLPDKELRLVIFILLTIQDFEYVIKKVLLHVAMQPGTSHVRLSPDCGVCSLRISFDSSYDFTQDLSCWFSAPFTLSVNIIQSNPNKIQKSTSNGYSDVPAYSHILLRQRFHRRTVHVVTKLRFRPPMAEVT